MLKNSILHTIIFFDLFDHPLTSTEVWEYVDIECGLQDVMKALEEMAGERIERKFGFYFLKGREEIVERRRARYNYFKKKLNRTKFVCHIFKYIPGVKMIAISNMIGSYNLRDGSDIDIFIITAPGRIWLVRFKTVVISALLRLRPTPARQKNKICLNFFLSEENLDVAKFKIEDDVYFDHWIAGLLPVYNKGNTFNDFIKANAWVRKVFPNKNFKYNSFRAQVGSRPSDFVLRVLDFFCGWSEPILKKIQLKLLAPGLRDAMNQGSQVVISDQALKLHAHDRREEFKEKYFSKIQNAKIKDQKE
jgi:hypothetical protein